MLDPGDWGLLIFSSVFLIFLLSGIGYAICVEHGRCVKCRRFKKKYDTKWLDERTPDNNWKGYTFYWCRSCRYSVPSKHDSAPSYYFTEIFKDSILPQKLKNKHMRKWIVNIFLIGLFYEILTFAPKIMDRLLR